MIMVATMNILALFTVISLVLLPNHLAISSESDGNTKGPQSEQYLLEVVQHLLGQHSKEQLFQKTRYDIQALLEDLNKLDNVEKKEEHSETKRNRESFKEEPTKKDNSLWSTQKIENLIHELDKKESGETKKEHQAGHILLEKFTKNGDNYRSKSKALTSYERSDVPSAARESAKLLAKYFRQGDTPKRK